MENYQILKNEILSYDAHLREGTFNTVFTAIHLPTNTYVALKRIVLPDGVLSLAVLRESLLIWELTHENIVRLQSIFVHEGNLFIAMEYVSTDLRKHRYSHEDNYPEIAKIFVKDMLTGLAYCHRIGIIHRDLKPENILVDVTNNRVKLADFGTARAFLTADKLPMTPEATTLVYRAPELLKDPVQYSTASDIWAVGCVFAEMLMEEADKVLFDGESEMQVLSKIIRIIGNGEGELSIAEMMAVVRESSELAASLLIGLLQFDPVKRLSADAALKHAYLN